MADVPEQGATDDAQAEERWEGPQVTEARVESIVRSDHPPVLPRLRSAVQPLVDQAVSRIQEEIPAYRGSPGSRRQRLITMAVSQGAQHFMQRLNDPRTSTAGIDDLFRRMGFGEAMDGHDVEDLKAALRISAREAWTALRDSVGTDAYPGSVLGRLGDELIGFIDHLIAQVETGHEMAVRMRADDTQAKRLELLREITSGRSEHIREHADLVGWPVPSRIVVIAATPTGQDDVAPHDLDDDVLADTTGGESAIWLAPAEKASDVVAHLSPLESVTRLAHSWPVAIDDAPHARRWAERALALAEVGAVPRIPAIDCTRYRTQLWLHSEPALRRELAQKLLKPLFDESPNSQEILSETLLVWLETRDSAPAIAAKLGVHPQTVRYRWKRINELFGDDLHDPEFVIQLTLVLKASVPLWLAGDMSDFERHKEQEAQ